MKPRRRHVYAPRGLDPDYEAIRGGPGLVVGTPLPAGEQCPHGGQYLKGVPMCGTCLYDPSRKFSDKDKVLGFVRHLNDICATVAFKASHRAFERTIPIADRKSICFTAIWKNLLTIYKNRTPLALAHTIADRALINEERRSYYWKERQTAATDEGADSGDGLERLARRAAEREDFEENSVRIFPDAKLVWNLRTVKCFMQLADEAMKRLPSWPFSSAEAIKWRCGFYGGKEIPWSAIAKHLSDPNSGRPVTERQIRYAVQQGVSAIKDHILSRLTPDLGEAVKNLRN